MGFPLHIKRVIDGRSAGSGFSQTGPERDSGSRLRTSPEFWGWLQPYDPYDPPSSAAAMRARRLLPAEEPLLKTAAGVTLPDREFAS